MENHKFTLIELLITVSIIAIVAGLLLPALASARKAAFQAGCSNNLNQIGKAEAMYSSDYNDYIVPVNAGGTYPSLRRGSSSETGIRSAKEFLSGFYSGGEFINDSMGARVKNPSPYGVSMIYGKNAKCTFVCPARGDTDFSWGSGFWKTGHLQPNGVSHPPLASGGAKNSIYINPSVVISWADGAGRTCSAIFWDSSAEIASIGYQGFVHGAGEFADRNENGGLDFTDKMLAVKGRSNTLYADGHVAAVSTAALYNVPKNPLHSSAYNNNKARYAYFSGIRR